MFAASAAATLLICAVAGWLGVAYWTGPRNQIIGKWKHTEKLPFPVKAGEAPESVLVYEFLRDGTVRVDSAVTGGILPFGLDFSASANGTYKFIDDSTKEIEPPAAKNGQVVRMKVAIRGDTLTFTSVGGRAVEFSRVR